MKTYALIAIGILASSPLAVLAENNQERFIELNAAQMDGVTAGMFTLPTPSAAITALAEALGTQTLTGTTTSSVVLGVQCTNGIRTSQEFHYSVQRTCHRNRRYQYKHLCRF